ncbi:hypothetical protein OIE68_40055 [Nocardia vinacea]|uniref:hypothetical protein n=1 Tax=Nocardia vinacea TaxID=96468 RepID=UPI002E0E2D6F|nr:hypothetical protein OIE68_40055 [Nocardia vinacea]
MSSKRGEKRKRRSRRSAAKPHQGAQSPGAVIDDPLGSVESAEQAVTATALRLLELAAPYDIFELVALLRFRFEQSEATEEPAGLGSAAAMELVTLILLVHNQQDSPEQPEFGVPVDYAEGIEAIVAAVDELISAGAVLMLVTTTRDTSSARRLSFGSVLREVFVRNLAYPHMVDDSLTALFDEPVVESHCQRVLGVTASQIRAVHAAIGDIYRQVWTDRVHTWTALANEVAEAADVDQALDIDSHLHTLAEDRSAYPLTSAVTVAAQSGLAIETVQTVLDLFTVSLPTDPPAHVALEFFRGGSPLRMRPLLRAEDGSYALAHDALFIHAIRERVEAELKSDNAAWNAYQKHRGEYLEASCLQLLAAHLPGYTVHSGFDYLVPENDAEQNPQDFTKKVEGDGLLILDDVACVVEAKAVAMRAPSRTGRSGPLWHDLRRMVTDAAEQGHRMRERILTDGGLRLVDGTWLDLSYIREVHTVAVTLDDLSGIATITHELIDAGLLTDENLPWVVSVYDLRVISELIERPSELLLYVRRRTEVELTKRLRAADELDYFVHFLDAQLYAEPDPGRTRRELPTLGVPSREQQRRYRQQRKTVEFLEGRTGQVDAWYQAGQHSASGSTSEKPHLRADPAALTLVDELGSRREPGWLAISTTILSGDTATQHRFGTIATKLAEETVRDGKSHRIAIPGGSTLADSFLLVWMNLVAPTSLEAARGELLRYLQAKKHQLQVARGFGMLYDAATGQILTTVYDNRIPGPDPGLDAEIAELGLWDVRATMRRPTRSLSRSSLRL